MKTIVIANQKGGVGKTTTASAIAAFLHKECGKNVLVVDSDPQGNLTASVGIDSDSAPGLFDVLCDDKKISDVLQKTSIGDLVACSIILSDADRRLTQAYSYNILSEKLQVISHNYDYCIIDAPPSLGILSLNAFNAAQYMIVPVNAAAFSIQGLRSLFDVITLVREKGNHEINILGILVTRYNSRTLMGKDVVEVLQEIAAKEHTKLFESKIRQSVVVESAQAERQDIFTFAPKSKVANDYQLFAEEVFKIISEE